MKDLHEVSGEILFPVDKPGNIFLYFIQELISAGRLQKSLALEGYRRLTGETRNPLPEKGGAYESGAFERRFISAEGAA
jgi:hypothetical protein